jgi:hypothetical protein
MSICFVLLTLILLFHLEFYIKAGFFALFDGRIFCVFLHDKIHIINRQNKRILSYILCNKSQINAHILH